jgi:hypothetical protein
MFQIKALAKNLFKHPVCVVIPTNQVDEKGITIDAKAFFIGHFQSVSVDEEQAAIANLTSFTKAASITDEEENQADVEEKINEISKTDFSGMFSTMNKQVTDVFIGFEKHPLHPMPFKDGESDAISSPETIKYLLNSKLVRKAVMTAYKEGCEKDISTKNSKK